MRIGVMIPELSLQDVGNLKIPSTGGNGSLCKSQLRIHIGRSAFEMPSSILREVYMRWRI